MYDVGIPSINTHYLHMTFGVDWADLVTLDLSQFEEPGGKARLAKQLQEAIQKIGNKSPSCISY